MLTFYRSRAGGGETPADLVHDPLPEDARWIDLFRPEPAEIAFVERTTGLSVPGRPELSEIESSSRLKSEKGAFYLSLPLIFHALTEEPVATPVGFVLTPERLVTVRFEELPSFAGFAARDLAAELDGLSRRLFRSPAIGGSRRRPPARESADLRIILGRVGHSGDLISKIRDSLLAIGRIVPYVSGLAVGWLPADVPPRLETLRQDVHSLSDYDDHIGSQVQLLLDATLGLINIEQNNIIKVLTIVSVVGIPPTLVASMYGMNFKMPEYGWSWGYPYGLLMIALSAIVPIVWFKLRGWI